MYHNPFDILDPGKIVYRINLAELSELIYQDNLKKFDVTELEFDKDRHFMAIACGHDLATIDIPISTIALIYGIDTAILAIKKAKRINGTSVTFSPKCCQHFIIDQLSLWQHQVFSGSGPQQPTELMQLIHPSKNEHELYFTMLRATTEAQEKKLTNTEFYQHVTDRLLEQFNCIRNAVIADISKDYEDYADKEYRINRKADWCTSHLAYWFHELERLQSPDAELPDFQEMLQVETEVFNYSIDCLLEAGETYASLKIQVLQHAQDVIHRQFIDQMQGIFFWTYAPLRVVTLDD